VKPDRGSRAGLPPNPVDAAGMPAVPYTDAYSGMADG